MTARFAPAVLLAVAAAGWAGTTMHTPDPTATAVRQMTDPKATDHLRAAHAARDRADLFGRFVPITLAAMAIVAAARSGVKS